MPHIADIKPGGKYHMVDLDRVGGVPVVMKHLLDAGLLHGDCLTVTGKTVAENLAAIDPPAPDGEVVHPLSDPIHAEGGIAVLARLARPQRRRRQGRRASTFDRFEGTARVFDGEDDAMEAVLAGRSSPAPSSSSATRAPRAAPACARCSPSPAP